MFRAVRPLDCVDVATSSIFYIITVDEIAHQDLESKLWWMAVSNHSWIKNQQ